MFVQVNHDSYSIEILWVYDDSITGRYWSIYKGISYNDVELVEPAKITDLRPHPLTADSATEYAVRLNKAARIADRLDTTFKSKADFENVVIAENDLGDDANGLPFIATAIGLGGKSLIIITPQKAKSDD